METKITLLPASEDPLQKFFYINEKRYSLLPVRAGFRKDPHSIHEASGLTFAFIHDQLFPPEKTVDDTKYIQTPNLQRAVLNAQLKVKKRNLSKNEVVVTTADVFVQLLMEPDIMDLLNAAGFDSNVCNSVLNVYNYANK